MNQHELIHKTDGLTVYFNKPLTHDQMLKAILGDDIEYYSVFEQFCEDEFQQQRILFDEWYQVYTLDFECEPTFNVFINGNITRIEPF